MGNIRTLDMEFLDELFEMSGGFVLKFSDRTFREFFAEELNINIDDPIYSTQGTSKAKRLRYFLQTVDKSMAERTLSALWEYREAKRLRNKEHDHVADAQQRLLAIISKLQGNTPRKPTTSDIPLQADRVQLRQLQDALLEVSRLDPHPTGFAFEKFLQKLFNAITIHQSNLTRSLKIS
jgi:hypothetical protein